MQFFIKPLTLLMIFTALTPGFSLTGSPEIETVNREMASKLYHQLAPRGENLFFSPFSIFTALSMTYAGAKNETQREMQTALNLPEAGPDFFKQFQDFSFVLKKIQEKKSVEIRLANTIWAQRTEPFLKKYLELLRTYFKSEIYGVDFKNPEAVRRLINLSVEKETKSRIKNLIPQGLLSALTRMVLVNAVYFKGEWLKAFDEKNTRSEDFLMRNGNKTRIPFMFQQNRFLYGQKNGVQILELPYAGKDLSLLALLPEKGTEIAPAENFLFSEEFSQLQGLMNTEKVRVFLPKIKLETSANLSEILQKLGMPLAFSDAADFSGMNGKRNLYIKAVLHKAFIEINEKGSEAAAATAVVMNTKSMNIDPERVYEFQANRPFLFLIRENTTGMILFLGRFEKP